ncbi:MAG: pitrilysin family protein, partial [Planctomycetota bacterium]
QRVPLQPVVSVHAWTKTGSIYEQEYTGAGLSHFLEHLVSGGTTATTTEDESNAILNRIGAQTNAATSLDTVRYFVNTTADHADEAIARVSDWMQNSVIPDNEFQRERDVIQREFDMGRGDANRIFWKLTQQARYTAHPARHPTIGYIDEFLDVTRDELLDYYHRMYPPNNTVFVVAGDIDPQATVDRVAELWMNAQSRDLPEITLPVEPELAEPVAVEGTADISRTRLRLAFPGVRLRSEHDYALDMLAAVLGQGESSRLVRDLRDERRWVTSIDAYNFSATWGEGFFGVDAEIADFEPPADTPGDTVEAQRLAAVKAAIREHLERVQAEPVEHDELDRVRRQVISGIAQRGQSAAAVASSLARDIISTRDPDYSQKYVDAIAELTPADLQAGAQFIVDFDKQMHVVLSPLSDDAAVTTMSREDDVDPASLPAETVDLDNASVIAEVTQALAEADAAAQPIAVDEPIRFTLPNGLRVILQRSTAVPAAAIDLYWVGGLLADTPGREGVANAAAGMLARGFDGRTNADIAAQVESLGAALSSGAGNNTSFIRANALSEDLDTVLGLVADAALRPDFPQDEWQRVQTRLVAAIESRADRWSTQVGDYFRADYYAGTTWQAPSTGVADVVRELTAEDLAAFHKQTLNPAATALTVVGDFDPDALRATIEAEFADLQPVASPVAYDTAPTDHRATLITHTTDKPLAAVVIGLGPGLKRDDPDYVPMQVLSNVLSAFPSGWLQQALRGEGPGLVYASGGYMQTGLRPGNYTILFNTSAEQIPEAVGRVIAVVERAKAGDFPPAEVDGAKARFLNDELAGKQANAARATTLALDELYGAPPKTGQQLLEAVQAITADDLQRVANKYFNAPVVVAMSQEPIDAAATRQAIGLDPDEPDASTQADTPDATTARVLGD